MSDRVADPLRAALGLLAVGLWAIPAAGGVSRWEAVLFAAVNQRPLGWLTPVLIVVMQAGALGAVAAAAGLAVLARERSLAVRLAVGGVAAWLAAKGVKALVGRGRPVELLPDVVVRSGESGGLGYPSGHVTVAAALFTVAAPFLPPRLRLAGWATVAVVAFARMYVGVHLPLDLLGGVALGVTVGACLRLLERVGPPIRRRRR